MILFINNDVQIEVERLNNAIGIRTDNYYNGDHAYVTITCEQAQSLIEMIKKAINEKD